MIIYWHAHPHWLGISLCLGRRIAQGFIWLEWSIMWVSVDSVAQNQQGNVCPPCFPHHRFSALLDPFVSMRLAANYPSQDKCRFPSQKEIICNPHLWGHWPFRGVGLFLLWFRLIKPCISVLLGGESVANRITFALVRREPKIPNQSTRTFQWHWIALAYLYGLCCKDNETPAIKEKKLLKWWNWLTEQLAFEIV